MMRYIFKIGWIIIVASNILFSQSTMTEDIDTIPANVSLREYQKLEHQKTIYHMIQRSWVANENLSYLAVAPYANSVSDRRIPLREGENRSSDFYLLEANINLNFPLFFGRETVSEKALKKKAKGQNSKRNRITFDYNGTFRMTLDESKPLTPGSNRVGFSWFVNLYNNYTGWIYGNGQTDQNQMLKSKEEDLKFFNFMLRAHHYSNGQAPGFFYVPDPENPDEFRNSYLDGDFSTNYLLFQFTKGKYNKQYGSLHQTSIGYRYDFGDDTSALAYSVEQEKSYGRHRLNGIYDYHTERFGKAMEYHFRTEIEYIMGNLDNFQANLVNDDNKYRFSIRTFIEVAPKKYRAVGYFFSAYYGRDYLNIRYDDIIYSLQLGITLSLDKFRFSH